MYIVDSSIKEVKDIDKSLTVESLLSTTNELSASIAHDSINRSSPPKGVANKLSVLLLPEPNAIGTQGENKSLAVFLPESNLYRELCTVSQHRPQSTEEVQL